MFFHPSKNGTLPYISTETKYGVLLNEIFVFDHFKSAEKRKNLQLQLIQDFYSLLNNKKNFDREIKRDYKNQATIKKLTKDQTFKPRLSPKSKTFRTTKIRESLTQKEYTNILSQKPQSKSKHKRKSIMELE